MVRKKIEIEDEPKSEPVEDLKAVEEEVGEAEEPADEEPEKKPLEGSGPKKPKSGKFKAFLKTKKGKAFAIIVGVIVLMALILAIPFTRYATLGLVVKKDVHITVQDSLTNKPVTDAGVTIGSVTGKTDARGAVTLTAVPVGRYDLKIDKQYYEEYSQSVTVPVVFGSADTTSVVVATGRPVEIKVVNKISGDTVPDASITISDTTATTDSKGVATIVLPDKKGDQTGVVEKDGYNVADVTVNITEGQTDQTVSITPAGKIFYLSKATGTINVMKASLDGTNASVVVEGTGSETDYGTVLLSTRDWKYSVLQSQRDGGSQERLYLVSSDVDGAKKIEDTVGAYALIGWQGHTLFYTVTEYNANYLLVSKVSVKAYDAETGKVTMVDQNEGAGESTQGVYEYFIDYAIMGNELIYMSQTHGDPMKLSSLRSVDVGSLKKKVVHEFGGSSQTDVNATLYEPYGYYIRISAYGQTHFYEYEDKVVKELDTDDKKFFSYYPTYIQSPSGNKTFWYEERDGKNTIFVGDKDGKNGTQIATLSDYKPYGWYGANDQYLLFSKNGSELYIAPADREISDGSILKITNYHKPGYSYAGYGSGYGGQ